MRQATHSLIQAPLVAGIFIADRLTKLWAQNWLKDHGPVLVLPFFRLTYIENTGAAWGLLTGWNSVLIGFSLALLGLLFYLRRRISRGSLWVYYGISLVAAGALGNLYDRIALGCVVDFLDFLVWPVFNLADSCITVGAVLMAWGLRR